MTAFLTSMSEPLFIISMNYGDEMLWKASPVSIDKLYFLITAFPQSPRSVVKAAKSDYDVSLLPFSNWFLISSKSDVKEIVLLVFKDSVILVFGE